VETEIGERGKRRRKCKDSKETEDYSCRRGRKKGKSWEE